MTPSAPSSASPGTSSDGARLPHAASFTTALAVLLVGLLMAKPMVKPAGAQSADTFGQTLEAVGEEYARLYAQPVVDAVGADLNSGFFYKSSVDQEGPIPGVNLYLGVKAFGSLVPRSDRSLSLDYAAPGSVTLEDGTKCISMGDVQYSIDDAPTAFGSTKAGEISVQNVSFQCDDGTVVDSSATLDLLPGVLDTGIAPLAVPQVGVGLPFTGTRVSLRFLPNIRYRDYGTIEFIGGGVRQEFGRFLPMIPLNLSAHLFYQSISLQEEVLGSESTEFVSASAFAGGVSASKSLSVFTFYGGLQFESMSANLGYTFDPGVDLATRTVDLEFSGANSFRLLTGVSAGLGPAVLNLDVSQGQRTVFSTGFGFQF